MKPFHLTKQTIRRSAVFLLTTLLSALLLYAANQYVTRDTVSFAGENTNQYVKAEVLEILSRDDMIISPDNVTSVTGYSITYQARILGGDLDGLEVTALQNYDPFVPVQNKQVEVGDKVILYRDASSGDPSWFTGDYARTDTLLILGIIFAICLLCFGRWKGVSTLISLVYTCLAVFAVFIPSILNGHSIYFWAVAVCLFIVAMTILLVNGANKLGLAAGLGCAGGILLSSILVLVLNYALHLTGLTDEDSIYLMYMNPENPADLKAVVFGAILIGAIGAIMDVTISIGSSLYEVMHKAPHITRRELIRSGFTIGRDTLGTMSNTLVLAYIGSSLPAVLLLCGYNRSLLFLLNREMIVVEILQALIGSAGMLFAVPFTTLMCALLFVRKGKGTAGKGSPAVAAQLPSPDMRQGEDSPAIPTGGRPAEEDAVSGLPDDTQPRP